MPPKVPLSEGFPKNSSNYATNTTNKSTNFNELLPQHTVNFSNCGAVSLTARPMIANSGVAGPQELVHFLVRVDCW